MLHTRYDNRSRRERWIDDRLHELYQMLQDDPHMYPGRKRDIETEIKALSAEKQQIAVQRNDALYFHKLRWEDL